MKLNLKTALAAATLSLGALALSTGAASAYVVCDSDGDCWHVHDQYTYPDGAHVIVHEDDWAWPKTEHYVWREHEGRGYWQNGIWVQF